MENGSKSKKDLQCPLCHEEIEIAKLILSIVNDEAYYQYTCEKCGTLIFLRKDTFLEYRLKEATKDYLNPSWRW